MSMLYMPSSAASKIFRQRILLTHLVTPLRLLVPPVSVYKQGIAHQSEQQSLKSRHEPELVRPLLYCCCLMHSSGCEFVQAVHTTVSASAIEKQA